MPATDIATTTIMIVLIMEPESNVHTGAVTTRANP
jgi:hypothetical protein